MNRTYLIGIDGATFHVLDHLAAEGHLPNLRALMSEGVRAELLSTPQPLTPPAWTTLMTGRTPGNHGIFDFIWAEERGNQAFFTLNNFRDIQVETVWTLVSRSGGSVTALNFPLTAPPPLVNGSIVPGLVSWKHLRRNVYPPALYQEMKQLPGFDPREMAWDFEREKQATKVVPEEEREDWIRFHIRRDRHWFELYRHLRRERPTDLTAILLDGTDKLQHICWPALDPDEHRSAGGPKRESERRLCIEYFAQLDRFIGDVVEEAEPDARIFLASDHGFGPSRMVFRLNRWLESQGYLTWGDTERLSEDERERVDKMVQNHFVYLDWQKTTAYAQSAATNGIHIRVARKPGETGIAPGDYESFRDRLVEELLAARDPESGEPVVTAVLKKEEAFPGANNERCPDLTVILSDHGFISTLNKDPIVWRRPEVSGTHRPEGVFLAHGRGIRAGARIAQQRILDIAPTLLYSLGLPVPSDFEGGVIRDAFEPEYLAAREIRVGDPTSIEAVDSRGKIADAEEEELIMSRLKALGYVN